MKNIELFRPSVFFVQETKYSRKGQLRLKDYEMFEYIRKSEGGSILTGVHCSLNPVLVSDGADEDLEIVVVEGNFSSERSKYNSDFLED